MNSLILFLCLNILIITAPCCGQATGNGDNRSPSNILNYLQNCIY